MGAEGKRQPQQPSGEVRVVMEGGGDRMPELDQTVAWELSLRSAHQEVACPRTRPHSRPLVQGLPQAISSARSSRSGNCNRPYPGGSTMVSGRKDSDVAQGD